MKKIMIVLCVLLVGMMTMGAGPSIKSYNEKFKMSADGSGQVSTQVEFIDLAPGTLEVPLTTWKGMQEIKWDEVPTGIQVQPVLKGVAPYLRLGIPQGAPSSFRMTFHLNIPAPKDEAKGKTDLVKEKILNFRFLNSGQAMVSDYSLKLLLPEGEVVHSVVEKTPKGKGNQATQVYFISEDNRQGLVFDAKKLNFGDAASIRLIAVQEEKSSALLVLLSVVAIIYMVGFRDIVKKPVELNKTDGKDKSNTTGTGISGF